MNIDELMNKAYLRKERDLWSLKVLSKVFHKNDDHRLDDIKMIDDFKERLAYVEKLYDSRNHYYELYLETNDESNYNILVNNYYTIEEQLDILKQICYNKFKITTHVFLDNLKLVELKEFDNCLTSIIKQFNNLDDACDYIYYHCGKDVSEYIKKVIEYCLEKQINNRLIPLEYLKSQQNIISLNSQELVKIYNALNITMKYLRSKDLTYQELYKQFMMMRVYYFISITNSEETTNV